MDFNSLYFIECVEYFNPEVDIYLYEFEKNKKSLYKCLRSLITSIIFRHKVPI